MQYLTLEKVKKVRPYLACLEKGSISHWVYQRRFKDAGCASRHQQTALYQELRELGDGDVDEAHRTHVKERYCRPPSYEGAAGCNGRCNGVVGAGLDVVAAEGLEWRQTLP